MTGSAQLVLTKAFSCNICSAPIPLETSKTDEHGKAVHEDCYVRKMKFRSLPSPGRSFPFSPPLEYHGLHSEPLGQPWLTSHSA